MSLANQRIQARFGLLLAMVWFVASVDAPSLAQDTNRAAETQGRVNRAAAPTGPLAVRNQAAQDGVEIVTLRYFRIKKGSFDEVLKVSREGVWPYFEKIGARVSGMWRVIPAPTSAPAATGDYDEVYMMTRYASMAHWEATRNAATLGGNGPDWEKCRAALDVRAGLTLSTNVIFLQGSMAPGGPYFMPAVVEATSK